MNGWEGRVIVTDSDYTVKGITEYIQKWSISSWLNSKRFEVVNKDMWQHLLEQIRDLERRGTDLWANESVRREKGFGAAFRQIAQADASAKVAALEGDVARYRRNFG